MLLLNILTHFDKIAPWKTCIKQLFLSFRNYLLFKHENIVVDVDGLFNLVVELRDGFVLVNRIVHGDLVLKVDY